MSVVKQINIPEEIQIHLREMEWTQDGKEVRGVIVQQLDRATYQKLDKILTKLGGKWNRKVKAHIFTVDPRPNFQKTDYNSIDFLVDGFYRTPLNVTESALSLFEPQPDSNSIFLEPSAGDGAIADVLREKGYSVHTYELNEFRRTQLLEKQHYVLGCDFLKCHPVEKYKWILMNPPFEKDQDIDHVNHAWNNFLDNGGQLISVMALGIMNVQTRKNKELRKLIEQHGKFVELPPKSFHNSGTDVNTCLVYMRKQI